MSAASSCRSFIITFPLFDSLHTSVLALLSPILNESEEAFTLKEVDGATTSYTLVQKAKASHCRKIAPGSQKQHWDQV